MSNQDRADGDSKDRQRRKSVQDEWISSDEKFQNTFLKIKAALEENRKDAERYRFIRRSLENAVVENPHIAGFQIQPIGKKYWFENAKDIDEAIDHFIRIENN